ncbi:response regulator [Candidatus Sumerlaeota bacterium]|nr:response regulator [Candidatus Sumerlaeota bacterium]
MSAVRILLVEDDPDIINLLQATLEPAFECLRAGNGLDALQMALEGEPDLVISDIMMPVLDGHEMVRRMRKYPALENLPVIFLSALGSQDHIKKGYQLGAALYLTKPIDPGRFRRNVELFVTDHGIEGGPKKKTAAEIQDAHTPKPGGAHAHRPTPGGQQSPSAKPSPAPRSTRSVTPAPVEHRPAPKPAETAQLTREAAPEPAAQRVRLLIVEDDAPLITRVASDLQRDYEVLTARDGIEAIERAARYKPDIFIIDMGVTKMNGYQLVMMLRKNFLFQTTPIIFTSEKDSARDKQYVEKLGVQYFLPKPYSTKDILPLIEQSVNEPFFEIHTDRIEYRQAMIELSMEGDINTPLSEALRVSGIMKAKESRDLWRD